LPEDVALGHTQEPLAGEEIHGERSAKKNKFNKGTRNHLKNLMLSIRASNAF